MTIRKKFIDAAAGYKKAILGDISKPYYNQVMDLISSTGHETGDGHFLSPLHMRALNACRNGTFVLPSSLLPSSPEMESVPSTLEIPAKKQKMEVEEEEEEEEEENETFKEKRKEMIKGKHEHEMKKVKDPYGAGTIWECDGCGKKGRSEVMHCSECDYDLCTECYSYSMN